MSTTLYFNAYKYKWELLGVIIVSGHKSTRVNSSKTNIKQNVQGMASIKCDY